MVAKGRKSRDELKAELSKLHSSQKARELKLEKTNLVIDESPSANSLRGNEIRFLKSLRKIRYYFQTYVSEAIEKRIKKLEGKMK